MNERGGRDGSDLTTGRRRFLLRAARITAWVVLAVATGLLVRAEGQRGDAPLPPGVTVEADLPYRPGLARGPRLDLYRPTAPAPSGGWPAIVAIHGGGWRGGSKHEYGRSLARLAGRGYVVAAIDYRLSRPGVPSWPANLDDARAAVRWLREHAGPLRIAPRRIAALGASAGGHLAALLGTYPDPSESAADSSRVAAVIDFYGPSELRVLGSPQAKAAKSVNLFLGGRPEECPDRYNAASPIGHVTPDDPPMLLIHGDDDALVPLDQSRALARALDRAGVPHRLIVVEHARHGFGLDPQGRDLLPEIVAFLDRAWAGSPRTD